MFLRDQQSIATELAVRCRDVYNTRWTLTEKHTAINHAVAQWGDRVSFPMHELLGSGAYDNDTRAYAVPAYADIQSLRVQRNVSDGTATDADVGQWVDMPGWNVQPTADNDGWLIVINSVPPENIPARISWQAQHGRMPYAFPTLNAEAAASDTSLTLATVEQFLAPCGYVLVDSEWIRYRGVTVGASTTTLSGLTRGVEGTTAAIHASGATVIFGVMVADGRLVEQLYNQAQAFLHQLSLQNAAEQNREYHERMVSHHISLAAEFWKTYHNPAWGSTRRRQFNAADWIW